MKMNFSFLKPVTKRGAFRKPRRVVYPEREWFIGLCIAIAIFVCGSAYAGTLFFRELTSTDAGGVSEEGDAYQHAPVRATLKKYQEKQASFEAKRAERHASAVPDILQVETDAVATTSTDIAEEPAPALSPTEGW